MVLESITDESNNYVENKDCYSELHAIKIALDNVDEWAVQSMI